MAHDHGRLLDGKVALITGGASGIGAATAELFARQGAAAIVLADLDEARAAAMARACEVAGAPALGLKMDVTDEASVTAGMTLAASRFGRLDILVNSAGISLRHAAMEMPVDVWDKVMAVNVKGTFLAARTAARHMQHGGGGSIVNLASIMSFSGFGFYPNPAYQASKGAVLNLTRALAVEWAPLGIRVNAVAPTWVRTPLIKPLLDSEAIMARLREVTPMQRIAEPAEVAEAILFLAGPASTMTTGHTLAVDGGFLAQ